MKRTILSVLAAGVLLTIACGGDGGYGGNPAAPSPSPSVPFSATDLTVGTGAEAVNGRTLTVNYTGWLYDANQPGNKGAQFDSTAGRGPYSFVLGAGRVIPGWEQGIVGMRVGGVRRLVIPPSLAYGSSGNGPIPPNATLLFEVELLAVN